MMIDVDEYKEIAECVYKGEQYSVRDNGAVMRHLREGKRPRKDDGVWTFGVKNNANGYMMIGDHRVHIIVATAFYGERDCKVYVVDHIDTNRCNNRKENLRWLTRLENVLMNPATLKRVTYLCGGDIMNFINNPSCLLDSNGTNNDISWMRTVSSDEARVAYENIQRWARKKSGPTLNIGNDNKNWMFEKRPSYYYDMEIPQDVFYHAHSPESALQKNWRTPTDFPCCPKFDEEPNINTYKSALVKDSVFSHNEYSHHIVLESMTIDDKTLLVMTEDTSKDAIKPYSVCRIIISGKQFIHECISTYFELNGAKKYYTIEQGKEWTGPETIDDYC